VGLIKHYYFTTDEQKFKMQVQEEVQKRLRENPPAETEGRFFTLIRVSDEVFDDATAAVTAATAANAARSAQSSSPSSSIPPSSSAAASPPTR